MSEKIPPDDYEKQRISLESGFRKLFPQVDMSNEEQNKAHAEFVALRRELSKSFNAGSPEVTEAKINAFLTSHGATPSEPAVMPSVAESKPIDVDWPIIDFNFDVPPKVVPVAGVETIAQSEEDEPKVFRSNREKKEGKKEEPSFEDRKKYLNSRNNKLRAKAKEYGIKFESFVRNTGERYRKLPLIYKIGVAGALLGMNVATGGASTLVTLLTSTAMIGQRALGAASAYALIDGLYEKRLTRKENERGSERTEFEKWKKRGYSTATALAVFTGLPGYAVKEGFDAIGGSGMLKALGALMGISPDTAELPHTIPKTAGAPAEPLVKPLVIDEIKQQIVEENARATTEVTTPQESRQALRTAVEKLTRVSATADAKFEMPKHADFSIHEDDTTISPYDVTPTDQSGVDDDIVQVSEESQPVAEPEVQQIQTETPIETAKPSAEPIETVPEAEPLPVVEVPKPEYATVDLTQEQVGVETAPAESMSAQVEHAKEWTNPNGVKIDPLRGGVYQYPNGVPVAYGKGALEAAQDFAKANPNTSVWVQSEKPVLYEGKLHQYVYEVKYGGFWRGMQILGVDGPSDPSHIITIDPNALVKRLGE